LNTHILQKIKKDRKKKEKEKRRNQDAEQCFQGYTSF
jgi:hypothetical protein